MTPIDPPHICKTIKPIEGEITIDDCIFKTYKWLASSDNWKGRILFVHGYRDHIGVYNEFAETLAINGYDFFFFYQRGEGESKLINKNIKGVSNDYYAYKGIDDMIDYNINDLKEKNLNIDKLHLMGLSMGGGLVLNYASNGKYKNQIKSFSVIGPLITLHKDTYPGFPIELVVRTICFLGGKQLRVKSPIKIDYITGDPDYQKFLLSNGDPKGLDGAFVETRDFILRGRNLLNYNTYSKISKDKPLLICHGEDDHVNDVEASKNFIEKLNSIENMNNKKIITYPNGRHSIVADIPEVRSKVIADILQFLNDNQ